MKLNWAPQLPGATLPMPPLGTPSARTTTLPRCGPGGMDLHFVLPFLVLLAGELLVGAEACLALGDARPRRHLRPFQLAGQRLAAGRLLLLFVCQAGLLL